MLRTMRLQCLFTFKFCLTVYIQRSSRICFTPWLFTVTGEYIIGRVVNNPCVYFAASLAIASTLVALSSLAKSRSDSALSTAVCAAALTTTSGLIVRTVSAIPSGLLKSPQYSLECTSTAIKLPSGASARWSSHPPALFYRTEEYSLLTFSVVLFDPTFISTAFHVVNPILIA